MFKHRKEAGELLAQKLGSFKGKKDVIVLGIPRGGVIVAKIISEKLKIPLDIIVVKKIGAPFNPELAIGAIGPEIKSKPVVYWDILLKELAIDTRSKNYELRIKNRERKEREKLLRGNKKPVSVKNRIVLLVDDGVATGATVRAASQFLQKAKVKKVILVTPVISKSTLRSLRTYFDTTVYLKAPADFRSVGEFYHEFPQVSDEEAKLMI